MMWIKESEFMKSNKIHIILLSMTYLGFIITNLMTLFFDFHIGLKCNVMISLFSDIFFLIYLWKQEPKQ